jgi:uncharacterized protein with ParB-like and HNH nuclease domain
MSTSEESIQAAHIGIGTALTRYDRLFVPPNQREYAWEEEHVDALFKDLKAAMAKGTYFLGTIVLTHGKQGFYEIADGQQRLATVSILFAAIRDYMADRNLPLLVEDINSYLYTVDPDANRRVPRLTLNFQDRDFFARRILPPKGDPERSISPTKPSQGLIATAQAAAAQYIQGLLAIEPQTAHVRVLNAWVKFIKTAAKVIVLPVPNALNAFILFETLNDRGVKTTQADLVKNYLFGEAEKDNRIADAQDKWSNMGSKLV